MGEQEVWSEGNVGARRAALGDEYGEIGAAAA